MKKIYNIAVIRGDGIGPEIIDEALNRFEEVFKHVKKTDKGLL